MTAIFSSSVGAASLFTGTYRRAPGALQKGFHNGWSLVNGRLLRSDILAAAAAESAHPQQQGETIEGPVWHSPIASPSLMDEPTYVYR